MIILMPRLIKSLKGGAGMNANTMRMKEINVDMVRHLLRNSRSSTKNSVSELTGLSVASCGNILNELVDSGEVFELDPAESTGGRPSRQFSYNFNHAHILALYVRKERSVRTVSTVVSDLAGKVLISKSVEMDHPGIRDIEEAVRGFVRMTPTIKSVSLGFPGVIHNGRIGICDIPELTDWDVCRQLEAEFSIPVTAENDVNLAALGSYHSSRYIRSESTAYIYYPDRGVVGAGIIINGRVLRGFNNFAGELSFLPLGYSRDEQPKLIESSSEFLSLVSRSILSVISIIDPQQIILAGLAFSEEMLCEIRRQVAEGIPLVDSPSIIFEKDIHESVTAGLIYLAISELSCGYELVHTRTHQE